MGIDDIKAGVRLISFLIPPFDGDAKRNRYDLSISLSVILGGALVTFHIAWVCGFLMFMGLTPPFAREGEVIEARERQDLQQQILGTIEANQIKDKIMEAKTHVCLAIRASDQAALDAWARELENQKQRYRDAVRQEPTIWGCDELLVGAPAAAGTHP